MDAQNAGNPLHLSFRCATFDDIAGIRDIYNYYIENTNNSWRYQTLDDAHFARWIENHAGGRRPAFVCEMDGKIVGYSSLSEFRAGEGYWPCAENTVYVLPEFTGRGIGRRLMEMLIDQGRCAGLKVIIASIDSGNQMSVRFHESFGFRQCGFLENIGWKNNQWLSVVFMQLDLK